MFIKIKYEKKLFRMLVLTTYFKAIEISEANRFVNNYQKMLKGK